LALLHVTASLEIQTNPKLATENNGIALVS